MPKRPPEPSDLEEQLADALAQIESLQAAAADAEARAGTAKAQLVESRDHASRLEGERAGLRAALAEAESARDSAQAELAQTGAQLRDAVLKYRDARLAAVPHIPADLVPAGGALEEVDRQLEAAQRVAEQMREKLQEETQSARVPVGAPPRRPPDLSGLSPAEKIRLGLQRLADR